MYPDGWGLAFLLWGVVSFVWITALSFLVLKERKFLQTLFPKEGKTFREKLNEVLEEVKGLEEFKRENIKNIQKLALKRYNPYKDTGGDQSFSLSLLNGEGDGVVVTSLHSRSGTRIFAKPVSKGRENGFEFSDEEKEAIDESIKSF